MGTKTVDGWEWHKEFHIYPLSCLLKSIDNISSSLQKKISSAYPSSHSLLPASTGRHKPLISCWNMILILPWLRDNHGTGFLNCSIDCGHFSSPGFRLLLPGPYPLTLPLPTSSTPFPASLPSHHHHLILFSPV